MLNNFSGALSGALLLCALLAAGVNGAVINPVDRWTRTATNPSTGSLGTPITVTWGLIAEGTPIAGDTNQPSNLISFLDTRIGNGAEPTPVTQKSWFTHFQQSFNRWSQVAGLTFVYEPNDLGAPLSSSTNPIGVLGQYPDVRIGGHFVDGESGSNTLAYNYFPNHSDLVLDTANPSFFGNSANNYRTLRNVLMHEVGHGLGLAHLESNNSSQLMEPFISTAFDGPQFHDILSMQRNYGDPLEKNGGNDTRATATLAGAFSGTGVWNIGTSASSIVGIIPPTATDFVSVDDNSDADYYRFTVAEPTNITIRLLPVGPTINQGPQGGVQTALNLSNLANLGLALFQDATPVQTVNLGGPSVPEQITALARPGFTYYVNAFSVTDDVQMYRLSIGYSPSLVPEPGSLLLLVAGLLILGAKRIRPRRQSQSASAA